MEKATPLTQLKPNNNTSDRDIIDNVLNELGDQDDQRDEDYDVIRNQQQDRYRQYQHDPSQHPPSQSQEGDGQEMMPQYIEEPSMMQMIWEGVKSPLLFAILYVALSQPIVHKTILKYMPESGMAVAYTVGIKAFLGAVLFFILRNFVMPMI